MKTLIVGTGKVGVMYGWALAQSGADICHIIRKESRSKVSGDVEMDVPDMREDPPRSCLTYMPRIVSAVVPGEAYELVLVATNHYQAASAVRQYRDFVPGADFLMFTANWEGTSEVDALLPRTHYLWGFSASSGARGEDGVLCANIRKRYRIGELDGSITSRLTRITVGRAQTTVDFLQRRFGRPVTPLQASYACTVMRLVVYLPSPSCSPRPRILLPRSIFKRIF